MRPLPDRDLHPDFGQSLGGYIVGARIGQGGMAAVYEATTPNGRAIALKRLLPRFSGSPEFTRMFLAEAQLAWQLRHPNILRVHDYGRDGEQLFMAMELVQGIDLLRLAWSARKAERPLPLWMSVYIARQISAALAYAHDFVDRAGQRRSVIHQDISPDNIFLSQAGEVKLGDFGIAYDPRRDKEGETPLMGKLPYLAPEQISGLSPDASSDLFSLAVVLWELVCMRPLFRAASAQELMARICAQERPPPSRVRPEVPSALDRLLLEALDPERRRRPTGEVFAARLDGVLAYLRPPVEPSEIADFIAPHLKDARRPRAELDEAEALSIDLEAPAPERPRRNGRTGYAFIRGREEGARPPDRPTPPARPRLDASTSQPAPPSSVPHSVTPSSPITPARPARRPSWSDESAPSFLLHAHRGRAGPMPAALLFSRLAEIDAATLPSIFVSLPEGPRASIEAIMDRMGEPMVRPELPAFTWMEQAELSGFAPILCRLAQQELSGRLIVLRPGQKHRVDIDLAAGNLVAVRSNRETLRDCATEAAREGSPLPKALAAWLSGHPSPKAALEALSRARAARMRRLLELLLTWRDARLGFTPQPAVPGEDGVSLLRLLPYLLEKSSTPAQLSVLLGPRWQKPASPARGFSDGLLALGLAPKLIELARSWQQGDTAEARLGGSEASKKEALLLAYLLWELRLVRPTR